MRSTRRAVWKASGVSALILTAVGSLCPRSGHGEPLGSRPERRAVAFLAREVPRWSKENHCFSCHNNGDAARALFAASRSPFAPPEEALRDTIDWLARPERWEENRVDPAFSDKPLARLQFTAALATAVQSGTVRDRSALLGAARRIADDQATDGSWTFEAEGTLGSPATYGRPLATALARQTLRTADPKRFAEPIARAEGWLRARPIVNVPDASAVLLGLTSANPRDREQLQRGLDLLRRAQSKTGGWGPYLNSAPEAFDTAIALLALNRWPDKNAVDALIRRGRASLISAQTDDGSWPETTRPSGGESYAQRLSTAGWATLALLATR